MSRKTRGGRSTASAGEEASPRERHEEFVRKNGEWNERVEESLAELDELAGNPMTESDEESPPP